MYKSFDNYLADLDDIYLTHLNLWITLSFQMAQFFIPPGFDYIEIK